MRESNRKIWITWEKHRRSRVLSRHFGFDIFEVVSEEKGVSRYLNSIVKTTRILLSERPRTLVVQNPSMFLTLWAVLCKAIFRYKLVVDRHTNFKFDKRKSKSPKWVLFKCISALTIKFSDITVVTNRGLARVVKRLGGTPFVLPDKIPDLEGRGRAKVKNEKDAGECIFFVCSFGQDEPVEEVIEAYRKFSSMVTLVVSGNWARRFSKSEIEDMPENVKFTGYISDIEFESLMANSLGVIVLTKNEFTLNCGAYEALSLNKPLLLSDTLALRSYFKRVATFVSLDSKDSILKGIQKFKNEIIDDNSDSRQKAVQDMKETWQVEADKLKDMMLR